MGNRLQASAASLLAVNDAATHTRSACRRYASSAPIPPQSKTTQISHANYLLNRIILVTCGCKPFSGVHSRRPETHNTATMKRRLSILLALVAATVITALAHSSHVLGNVRNVVREDGAVVESNEYYPYGGLFSATPSVQPYKYGAQPLARRSGRCNVGRMPVATTKTTFGN